MEKELQSHLLRLSILLATSLSALLEPTEPTILRDASSIASTSSTNQNPISKQIHNDLVSLIKSVQQACTNLTLALRPDGKTLQQQSDAASPLISPVQGLDKASLEAANAQIIAIANEHVPKLVFLSRKATSEAAVYQYVAKTDEDVEREKHELAMVKARGGHVVQPAYARETEKLAKLKGKGVGKAWAKSVVSVVFELFDAIGELSRTYMDERTRIVLQKASLTRQRLDGMASTQQDAQQQKTPLPKTAIEARQQALQATGVVWGICDAAVKEKLLADNRAAVRLSWKQHTDVLKDALREFTEAIDADSDEGKGEQGDDDVDPDDPLAGLEDMTLTEEQKAIAKTYTPLLKACCKLHVIVGKECLGAPKDASAKPCMVDLDDLDAAGSAMVEGVDDLIAVLLYGVDDDRSTESNEDDEDESEGDAAENELRKFVETAKGVFEAASDDAEASAAINEQWREIQSLAAELKLKIA